MSSKTKIVARAMPVDVVQQQQQLYVVLLLELATDSPQQARNNQHIRYLPGNRRNERKQNEIPPDEGCACTSWLLKYLVGMLPIYQVDASIGHGLHSPRAWGSGGPCYNFVQGRTKYVVGMGVLQFSIFYRKINTRNLTNELT